MARAGHRTTLDVAVLNLAPGRWYYRVRGMNADADRRLEHDLVEAGRRDRVAADVPRQLSLAE